jgi:transposase InsO family protein
VGRIRGERRVPAPPTGKPPRQKERVVAARYPNHVLMLDITEIPVLFRIFTVKLALCIDVWSRMPLGAWGFRHEPTAAEIAELFTDVVERHGNALHLVTDQGPQLTAAAFRGTVTSHGTRQRFGAVGRHGSIAIVERLFRTVKDILRQPFRADLHLEDHRRRIDLALLWYSWCRPHMALGGAVPAEAYFGLRPAHLDAVAPPRGRRGEKKNRTPAPFELVLLDQELRLPVLLPRAA